MKKYCTTYARWYAALGLMLGIILTEFLRAPFPTVYQEWWAIIGGIIGGLIGYLIGKYKT
jgi:small basic protein